MIKRLWITALALLALCGAASAQAPVKPCIDTTNTTLGTHDCFPVSSTNPLPVNQTTPAAGSGNAGYPPGSTVTGTSLSAADTTTQGISFGGGAAGQFYYVCGIDVDGLGATAATTVTVTLSGLAPGITFSWEYTFPLGATVTSTPLVKSWSPCLRGTGPLTAPTLTVPGAAGNTLTNLKMNGYFQ